ncbi:class I SAM-dependent methyltransferase [Methanogenium sp. S4BF]|uniref:class I SAM-dependent methyltransferase n=1 Tax=Methanogenium sp. S4BF TaxID=1789226 RepID=UPI00241775E6|nr:class I SAM-dependent methyltransferase [Methanogenium sp. S4BF]WFN34982.1 class I SAM-dependent methyltransferase [Methanogenium sp. S4BF]
MNYMEKTQYFCPKHKLPLKYTYNNEYQCPEGCKYPIVRNIPRFVTDDNYSSSFGLQWNAFRKTQLDSINNLSISRDRLRRLMGGSFEHLIGKNILEAGCGAGRFTEILLSERANVTALDLSSAVEANYDNCSQYPDYSVCQANILHLPFDVETFDIVMCIGVIQHTPNPEETIKKLCSYVRPGGQLIIDHYSLEYPQPLFRRIIRALCLKFPSEISLDIVTMITKCIWPIHRILWKYHSIKPINMVRSVFLKLSPVVDYHDSYPQLSEKLQFEWALLDTHDTLTDYYKHLRSEDDIKLILTECDLLNIHTEIAGNGIEARAQKRI